MDLMELQRRFVNQRFGMFIHFNSATFQFHQGDIVDWEFDYENHGAPRRYPFDPKDWNPDQLDCEQWARAAKSAGMTFAALTAKHHEGFDLWPSEHTGHCVKNGTDKRDVVGEYLKAFRAQGIEAGLYFSMLDLAHDIRRGGCTDQQKQLIKAQLTELLTRYGRIPFLIIDGWNASWGGPLYDRVPFEEIDALVKGLQTDCLLMNISCESNLDHTDVVFFECAAGQTMEQDFNGPGIGCNYLTSQWFYRDTDRDMVLRSAKWALDTVREMNEKNAAFLLNVSPNTHGRLDENVIQRLKEIGAQYRPLPPIERLPEDWLRR